MKLIIILGILSVLLLSGCSEKEYKPIFTNSSDLNLSIKSPLLKYNIGQVKFIECLYTHSYTVHAEKNDSTVGHMVFYNKTCEEKILNETRT